MNKNDLFNERLLSSNLLKAVAMMFIIVNHTVIYTKGTNG